MKLIPATTSQMLLTLAGLAGLSSAMMVWLIPAPQVKITAEPQDIEWHLPKLPTINSQAAFDKLRQLQAWGKDAEVAETTTVAGGASNSSTQPNKSKEITWKLVGTVTKGQQRFMLSVDSLDKEKKVNRYKELATLPDGSVIMGVEDDRVRIRDKEDEYKVLKMYQPPEKSK
ncbi:MAG: hypothetical protein R3E08_02795 [Thiotrichaceae bacterium]